MNFWEYLCLVCNLRYKHCLLLHKLWVFHRYHLSSFVNSNLLRLFIMNRYLICVRCFFDLYSVLFIFSYFCWCGELYCFSNVVPVLFLGWSCIMYLFMCCWIWIANICLFFNISRRYIPIICKLTLVLFF